MSCDLISWNTIAIEVPINLDHQLKCSSCKNNLINYCIDCHNNNFSYSKCIIFNCNNISIYNYNASKNEEYCEKHKHKNMVNKIKQNCKIVKGYCNCYFHTHCIKKWIEINNCCPNCEKEWKFKMEI